MIKLKKDQNYKKWKKFAKIVRSKENSKKIDIYLENIKLIFQYYIYFYTITILYFFKYYYKYFNNIDYLFKNF